MRATNCSRAAAGIKRAICYARLARHYAERGACTDASLYAGDAHGHAVLTQGRNFPRAMKIADAALEKATACWTKKGR